MKAWFDSPEFEKEFHYDGPLGAFCGKEGTTFSLWAPTAQHVQLRLYEAGDGCGVRQTAEMTRLSRGVWVYQTGENLEGSYYDYRVTVDAVTYTTQDPYARACGLNGHRSMVLDLKKTDPEGWEQDKAPEKTPEQVIYEVHIRDFSWDPAGGFDPEDRGRFSALTKEGTTLNGDGIHPTGLDYMKKLGVTHVQIMPMYDYGSVDEANVASSYNWGYDPVNYNVPEGSYSSDPRQGQVRIRELKEMIAGLHKAGFRVIMDVVYNHTYHLESCLFKTAPWYYYRQKADGSPSNGSGCGNDIASERSMCGRYILESALYWVEQYHIDGFRFDLMGLMDAPLMERLQKELDRRYGVGEKLVYGEPWRADTTAARPGTVLADKDHLRNLRGNIGAFCDDTRDAIKGSVMNLKSVGFVNGGGIRGKTLRNCIVGWAGEGMPFRSPDQTVTYLSCHDDWTLWDKLVYTLDPYENYTAIQPSVLQANKLAAAMNFCCQGRPFFLAGEEFGRTKGGIKNSYCSASEVNQIDWTRTHQNRELVDWYRGLIGLRQQLPGLQDKSPMAHKRVLWSVGADPDWTVVCLDNRGPGSRWDQLLLVFQCGKDSRQGNLPAGKWQVLVDSQSSFRWQEELLVAGKCTARPMSALILGKVK